MTAELPNPLWEQQGDWVLSLAHSSTYLACSLSNGAVQVYDQQRLHLVASYPSAVHGQTVANAIQFGPDGTTLVSVGQNGTLVLFDIRQAQPVLSSTASPHRVSLQSVSLGFHGTLAAAGSMKGKIHFMDLRQGGNLLGAYIDSHRDAVTQVHFASPASSLLLSGAEDGLLYCFDTAQPTEESALRSVVNTGTPLRRIGFCGTDAPPGGIPRAVFCITGSETATIWDLHSAACLQSFGGGSQLRTTLTETLNGIRLTDPVSTNSTQPHPFTVDYLVDAHWDELRRSLLLAVGSAEGDGALLQLSSNCPTSQWEGVALYRGAHRGVIRSWCPLQLSPNIVSVTAGEDARIIEWDHHNHQQQPTLSHYNNTTQDGTSSMTTSSYPSILSGSCRKQASSSMVTGIVGGHGSEPTTGLIDHSVMIKRRSISSSANDSIPVVDDIMLMDDMKHVGPVLSFDSEPPKRQKTSLE